MEALNVRLINPIVAILTGGNIKSILSWIPPSLHQSCIFSMRGSLHVF
jgi:hypothetical protein